MITNLHLLNFQIHEDRDIPLTPVTTIVGGNGSGKSAVMRAIRWLVTNRPTGDSFVRDGETDCHAEMTLDDHKVMRSRVNGENIYTIDGEEYKAFGAGIPSDVTDTLNISPFSFQGQFDSLFMLTLPPGQVAEMLNDVVDLSLIDSSAKYIASKMREASSELNTATTRCDELGLALARLNWVDGAAAVVTELVEIAEEVDSLREKYGRCKGMMASVAKETTLRESAWPVIVEHELLGRIHTELENTTYACISAGGGLEQLEKLYIEQDALLSRLSDVTKEHDKLKKGKCPLCGRQ